MKLKCKLGRTIPVLFNESDDAKTLLQKSVDKYKRHYKQFDNGDIYIILYQDMTQVKNLPGSNTPFTLGVYKRDLLKPYSKIFFSLCSMEDFEICTCDNDESENEDLMCSGAFGLSEGKGSDNEDLMSLTPIATPLVTLFHAIDDKSVYSRDSPSTSSQSSRGAGPGIEKYLVPHQCPTCLLYFARDEIESHADACAENWLDTVGECPVVVNLSEEQDVENDHPEEIPPLDHIENIPERLEAMKRIVQKLKGNVKNTSINRVAIRRRCAFEDYMDARLKRFFKPEGLLKVCFTGEPPIDGGGPRREFFTGTH